MKSKPKIRKRSATARKPSRGERGESLLETMISAVVLGVGLLTIMGVLSAVGVKLNSNQGDRGTRTTEYAQDKMEQLLALNFNDAASNTAVYPTANSGGTGLGGVMSGSSTVGGVTVGRSVTGYRDYINSAGNVQASSTGALYIRQWSVSTNATSTLKTITVVTRVITSSSDATSDPFTRLVSVKSQL